MPAPAIYVLAIVGTVAAGLAFKEFVYEPHIAPKLEKWAEEFIALRRERKRVREPPVSVAQPFPSGHKTSKRSDDGNDEDDKSVFELEKLVSHVTEEVQEWRNEVERSQPSTLRQRRNGKNYTSNIESYSSVGFTGTSHVIFDSSTTASSRIASSAASQRSRSRETLRSPPPATVPGHLPTPDMSVHVGSPNATPPDLITLSPTSIPSLSLSHPVDLDQEHGIVLLSAPSSRPETPITSISTLDDFHSFLQSDSDDDAVSVAVSSMSEFDDLRSNFGSEMSWASVTPRSP